MNISEKIKTNGFISAILLAIVGVLFCTLRSQFVSALLTVVGVVLIILGILDLIGKKWALGAIELAVGIIIIACGWTIVDITLLILGIVLIIYAIYSFVCNIPKIKSANKYDKVLFVLNPLIMLVIGILLVVARWYMVDAVFIVLGVIAIAEGIMLFISSLKADKASK